MKMPWFLLFSSLLFATPVWALQVLNEGELSAVHAQSGIDIGVQDFKASLTIKDLTFTTVGNRNEFGLPHPDGEASISMDMETHVLMKERLLRIDVGDVDSRKQTINGHKSGYAIVDRFKYCDALRLGSLATLDRTFSPTAPNTPDYGKNGPHWGKKWWHELTNLAPDPLLSGKTGIRFVIPANDRTDTNYRFRIRARQADRRLDLGTISGSGFRFPKNSKTYEPPPLKATIMAGWKGNAGLAAEFKLRLHQDRLDYESPGNRQSINVSGLFLKEAFTDDLRIRHTDRPYEYDTESEHTGHFQKLLLENGKYRTNRKWKADFANYFNSLTAVNAPQKNNNGYFMIGNLAVPDFEDIVAGGPEALKPEGSSKKDRFANPDAQVRKIGSRLMQRMPDGTWKEVRLKANPVTLDIGGPQQALVEVLNAPGEPHYDKSKPLGLYYKKWMPIASGTGIRMQLPMYGSIRVGEIRVRDTGGINSDFTERSMGPMAIDGLRVHSLEVRFPARGTESNPYAANPDKLPEYYPAY